MTVAFTDQIADLTYSDGETTWKLFDGLEIRQLRRTQRSYP